MIALSARLRVWVASEPADFRCGIDGLARRVRQTLAEDRVLSAMLREIPALGWYLGRPVTTVREAYQCHRLYLQLSAPE